MTMMRTTKPMVMIIVKRANNILELLAWKLWNFWIGKLWIKIKKQHSDFSNYKCAGIKLLPINASFTFSRHESEHKIIFSQIISTFPSSRCCWFTFGNFAKDLLVRLSSPNKFWNATDVFFLMWIIFRCNFRPFKFYRYRLVPHFRFVKQWVLALNLHRFFVVALLKMI